MKLIIDVLACLYTQKNPDRSDIVIRICRDKFMSGFIKLKSV